MSWLMLEVYKLLVKTSKKHNKYYNAAMMPHQALCRENFRNIIYFFHGTK